jgi:hypothetical protein
MFRPREDHCHGGIYEGVQAQKIQSKTACIVKYKKDVPRQAEVALGVPGRLRPRIISTFGTTKVVGRLSTVRTGRLYPRRNPWYAFSEAVDPRARGFVGRNHGKNPQ